MTKQSTLEQPKTHHLSHQPKPVFASQKLAGFAEFAQICSTTPTRNRDANGNRTSKTTPWGTVAYSYDAENRLVESGELGKSESVKYTYDKNGNLLSEVAARYRKDYVYNAQNRMIFSDVQDAFLNTRNLTEYAYDAFGRRIETIEYLGDHTRNLYDGFSFDVVGKTLLQTRSAPAMTEQKYRAGVAGAASAAGHPELGSGSAAGRSGAGVANGTRYRYIGDEPLENSGSAGAGNAGANAGTTAAAKTRSRPNSEYVLYAQGEPVAVNSDNGVSYFSTDILGSVRSVTDRNGQVKASYEYDAFGSPYLANLENDVGFGYCGKVYDSDTGLYDYGFRDYAPNSARFTTVDPVRDGSNWFSYVVNDPVNYVDLFGLTSSDVTFNSNVLSNPIIGNKFVSNNWIVGDGWATATSGATLNGLTQTTGVPWTTTSWDQSRNPTTLQIGETITWNTSLPFSNVTFSEGSTSTTSPTVTAQSFSQSSNFASARMYNAETVDTRPVMYNAEGTRGSPGKLQHTDLTGWNRFIAELNDCIGVYGSLGLGAQRNFEILGIKSDIGVNLGSREIRYDKYGKLVEDVIAFNVNIKIQNWGTLGLSIEKRSNAYGVGDDFIDCLINAWTGAGELQISPLADINIRDTASLTGDNYDFIIGISGQALVGGGAWLNLREIGDLVIYLWEEKIKNLF